MIPLHLAISIGHRKWSPLNQFYSQDINLCGPLPSRKSKLLKTPNQPLLTSFYDYECGNSFSFSYMTGVILLLKCRTGSIPKTNLGIIPLQKFPEIRAITYYVEYRFQLKLISNKNFNIIWPKEFGKNHALPLWTPLQRKGGVCNCNLLFSFWKFAICLSIFKNCERGEKANLTNLVSPIFLG